MFVVTMTGSTGPRHLMAATGGPAGEVPRQGVPFRVDLAVA